ncbi:ankyrin repeat domain-containing protein [Flavobacterium sp.]|uniref:ankyrin repeat domain-containing protein n=1 Tax=Flavobacterium sp. TaxID=239 RepID=UPI0026171E66|nr:ankyrin repeat domain-containing protein [Flavobacterium sp.]
MIKFLLIFFISFASVFGQQKSCFEIARKGSLDEIKVLFEKDNAVVNAIDDKGSSMLILACYRGNDAVANFLIDNKADINYSSSNGTPLMACVVKGEFELVDKLLLKGANVDLTDVNGLTALMLAVQFNNPEMVKKLLNANANKELKCKNNKTAFEYAVEFNYEDIINLLK